MAHSFATIFKLTHLPASRKGIYWIINPSLPGPLQIALRLEIDLGGEAEPLDRDDWGEDLLAPLLPGHLFTLFLFLLGLLYDLFLNVGGDLLIM